jgi:CubicO group peptidase (beta-lactamase class C family)
MNTHLKSAALALCLMLQACGGGSGTSPTPPLRVAASTEEQWTLSPPAEVGIDGAQLEKAATLSPGHGISSMLILRHGKPVFERYWNGFDKDTLHDLRSATKSITALMVGVAIDQGMLKGADQPIADHLRASYPSAPGLRDNITLAHLLTMSSGLACNDFNNTSPGNEEKMYPTKDWVRFFVDLPRNAAPGAVTYYCTAGVVTLGRIVAEASKRAIPDFADTYLFGALGIRHAQWATFDDKRQTDTGGHLFLRPRDMAKLGQMVLQKGMWNGRQLVSSAWIDTATSKHTRIGQTDYGYLWWQRNLVYQGRTVRMHYADGNGGQYIFVIPELDLAAVFTGENYNASLAQQALYVMESAVLPAIR